MYKKLTLNLGVESVQQSVVFYRDLLGFDVDATVPKDAPYDWALVSYGKISIMFQTKTSLKKAIPAFVVRETGGIQTLYFEVENILYFYHKMKGQVKIILDLTTTEWDTKEFTIQDPDGYAITFAQDLI